MYPDLPYIIILLCLMPDDFTLLNLLVAMCPGQWVNQTICSCTLLTFLVGNPPRYALRYYFTLSNAR
jgi:hypothetical protein